jgi:hypothetical protein
VQHLLLLLLTVLFLDDGQVAGLAGYVQEKGCWQPSVMR